jgi:HEAT repeat protein
MALTRSKSTKPATPAEPPSLDSPNANVRLAAVREMADDPASVPTLLSFVGTEPDRAVREVALTELADLDTVEIARALVPYLRADEAGLRNAVLEALRVMPKAVPDLIPELLRDADPDVRILAAMALVNSPHRQTREWLETALSGEQHPNVVSALLEAWLPLVDQAALPLLRLLRERFPDDPFITFVAERAGPGSD